MGGYCEIYCDNGTGEYVTKGGYNTSNAQSLKYTMQAVTINGGSNWQESETYSSPADGEPINNGPATWSTWGCACVLIYSRQLDSDEISQVMNWLKQEYFGI